MRPITNNANDFSTGNALSTAPLPADADSVAQFQSLMAAKSPETPAGPKEPKPLATDEQMEKVQPADLRRLREKWGADEKGFLEEAYEYYEMAVATLESNMQMLAISEYKRRQEEKSRLKD